MKALFKKAQSDIDYKKIVIIILFLIMIYVVAQTLVKVNASVVPG